MIHYRKYAELRKGKIMSMNMEQFERHCKLAQDAFPEEDYIWFGTFLYGSQNYGLDTEESDIDTVSLYIPTIKTLSREDGNARMLAIENELNDYYTDSPKVKDHIGFRDIRLWIKELIVGNPTSIELFYSTCKEINDKFYDAWLNLNSLDVLKFNPERTISALKGMVSSNLKHTWKPREGNEKDSDRRYNVKAFSEAIRLIHTLFNYINPNSNYMNVFVPKDAVREFILSAKNGELMYEDAKAWTGVCEYILRNFDFLKKPVRAFTDGPEFLRDWAERLFEMALIKS